VQACKDGEQALGSAEYATAEAAFRAALRMQKSDEATVQYVYDDY
jgi:hypothetical protein